MIRAYVTKKNFHPLVACVTQRSEICRRFVTVGTHRVVVSTHCQIDETDGKMQGKWAIPQGWDVAKSAISFTRRAEVSFVLLVTFSRNSRVGEHRQYYTSDYCKAIWWHWVSQESFKKHKVSRVDPAITA